MTRDECLEIIRMARESNRMPDLSGVDLSGVDLSGVDLSGVNLSGADLFGADLSGADLFGACYGDQVAMTIEPIQLHGLQYFVLILDTHIKIGCELHSIADWRDFDDRKILEMDGKRALEWWRVWKKPILGIAEEHEKVARQ